MASPIDWFNKNSLSKLWAKIDSLFARKTDIQTMIKAGTATNTVDETKSADSSYFRFMPYTDTENVAYKYIRLNMTGATTSDAGLMSASDKAKLEGIETGATNVTVDSVLSSSSVNPVRNSVIYNALAGKIDVPTGGTAGQVLTKTADGEEWQDAPEPTYATVTIAVSDWFSLTAIKNVDAVTQASVIFCSADPSCEIVASEAHVYCSAQGDSTLTFSCVSVPKSDVIMNIEVREEA